MPNLPKKKTKNSPPGWLSLLLATCFLAFACSCREEGTETSVVLKDATGLEVLSVQVEVADSPSERALGLMNRESLAADRGMLFVFTSDSTDAFWMKDTRISLDLIFIDALGVIVDVIENVVPLSEALLISDAPYRYVLEVNGGTAARYGIVVGGRVQIPQGVAGAAAGAGAVSGATAVSAAAGWVSVGC